MRQQNKQLLKDFLANQMKRFRKEHGLTQEMMSEQLRISPRSYINLEHRRYGCSALTLVCFLLQLNDEEVIQLLNDFHSLLERSDHHDAA